MTSFLVNAQTYTPRYYTTGWLPPGGSYGSGDDPSTPMLLNSTTFDTEMIARLQNSQTPVHMRFYPGDYETAGLMWIYNKNVRLSGLPSNPYTVNWKIKSNSPPIDYGAGLMVLYALRSGQYLDNFEVEDIIIDCNWLGHTLYNSSSHTKGFKLGGLSAHVVKGRAERVTVKYFGSNGILPFTGSGVETFPLMMITGSFGQTSTPITIRNCQVLNFTSLAGGYCTAINVVTRDPEVPWSANCSSRIVGQQFPPGCFTTTYTAIVETNLVQSVPNGIGLGTADSEGVLFKLNSVFYTSSGFNCDTKHTEPPYQYGSNPQYIFIQNNKFHYCNQGVSVGATQWGSPTFNSFTIQDNDFYLQGMWDNPVSGYPWMLCYGVRLAGGTASCVITGNKFTTVPSGSFTWDPDPANYGATKYYYPFQEVSGSYKMTQCRELDSCTSTCPSTPTPLNPECRTYNVWSNSDSGNTVNGAYYSGSVKNLPFAPQ